ncbi:leucine-rich repeat receptor-like serine/threonine/tyrosine-protein kinase SOBIR1, partial [Tanacetum coccineum]
AIKKIVLREPDDTSSDYQNLVDQVNKDSEIGKRIRHWNVVSLIACVSTPSLTYTTLVQMIKNIKNSSHQVREIIPTLIGSRHENQVLRVLNLAMFLVRACLRDTQVAIKKIVLEEPDDTSVDYHNLVEQVKAKTKSRKRIRHQNVIPLLAYVSTPSFGIFLVEMVTLMSPSSLTNTTLVQLINNIKILAHPVREIDPTLLRRRHENQVFRFLNLVVRCVYLNYDFSNIGSLEKMRRDVREGSLVLDWPLKYKIVVGVANGLEYLHYGVTTNFVNRDLKPDNILLDPNIEAGIADFGLAKQPGETSADYQNLVDQVNTDLGIRKRIRHRNVVLLLARVFTPRPLEYKIVVGVANGIEYLHHGVTLNVTHQDLKPNNILLDQDIEAGIADFGLAMPILDCETSL